MTTHPISQRGATMTATSDANEGRTGRKPTIEEAEAILTLVRGGWLRLTLNLNLDAEVEDAER